MYQRKTRDVWTLQGNYGSGWEDLTSELAFSEIRQRLREYRDNEPGVAFRLRKQREPRRMRSRCASADFTFLDEVLRAESMPRCQGERRARVIKPGDQSGPFGVPKQSTFTADEFLTYFGRALLAENGDAYV